MSLAGGSGGGGGGGVIGWERVVMVRKGHVPSRSTSLVGSSDDS